MPTYPLVRIALRYGIGGILALFLGSDAGVEVGDMLAADPDIVDAVAVGASLVIAAITEWWWTRARKTGGDT